MLPKGSVGQFGPWSGRVASVSLGGMGESFPALPVDPWQEVSRTWWIGS